MKPTRTQRFFLTACLLLTAGVMNVQAQTTYIKANNTTALATSGSWTIAGSPGSSDIGKWDSTVTAANATVLGADTSWAGLAISNPGGLVTINAGNTLTLGTSGIDMSGASQSLTLNCALTLGGVQTWNVASGKTLTFGGVVSGANLLTIAGAGSTTIGLNDLNVSAGLTKTGAGTLTITGGAGNAATIGAGSTLTHNGGLINLNNPTAGVANVLNSTANVAVGGGTLIYTFAASGINQNLNNITINSGESGLFANRNGSFNSALVFAGTATRSVGGTVTGRPVDTGRQATTFSGLTASTAILTASGTPYATVGNSTATAGQDNYNDWGGLDSSKRLTTATYNNVASATALATPNPNAQSGFPTVTLAANTSITSYRDNNNALMTIDLNGKTLTVGGILIPSIKTTAGSIIKDTPGTGSMTGPASSDIVMMISANNTTPQPFTISAKIIDNTSTAITKGAPGTLILSGNNTFTGGVHINDGTIQLGSAGALNSTTFNSINFNGSGMITGIANTSPGTVASAPTLVLAGNSVSVSSLSTANNLSGSVPVIGNANGSSVANATLTVNGSAVTTFTGTVKDGTGGGTLGIAKSGAGTQTLGGTLSYSGATTVNAGNLTLTATPSATSGYVVNGTLDVTAFSGSTLALTASQFLTGSGTVNGSVTTTAGTKLAPGSGTATTGGSGTNTMNNLTLTGGSIINYGLNAADSNNCLLSVGGGTLTLPVSGTVTLNLYTPGTSTPFAAAGTYNLFQYTTGMNVTSLASRFTIGTSITGFIPTFGTAAGPGGTTYLTLTLIVNTGAVTTWNPAVDADGNWSVAGNWNPAVVPHAPEDSATLGVAAGLRTVTLDANETVGTLAMTNANSFVVANAGNILTFDNGGFGAGVTVSGGTANAIQTAVALNDNTVVAVGGGKTLTVSGTIANSTVPETLTVNGAGTTILSVANTYGPAVGSVGTSLSGGGVLQVGNAGSLGAGDLGVVGSSTLKAGAAMSIANNVGVGGGVIATVDNNTFDVTLGGVISGGGSLVKNNTGKLTLGGANSYGGSTTVNAGTMSIAAENNLGATPGSATPNSVVLNGGDLLATASLTLSANRGVGIGPATGSTPGTALIDAATGQTLAVNGIIASTGNSGANNLTVNSLAASPGTVSLGGANTFSGTTVIANGTLQISNSLALQNSVLSYNTGTLTFGSGITAATVAQLTGSQGLVLNNQSGTPAGVNLTMGGNNAAWTYAANFSGFGSLTKNGSGKLTLTGNNSYTNSTTVNAGTLELPSPGVINGGPLNGQGFLIDGGTLTSVGTSIFNANNTAFTESSGTVNMGDFAEVNNAGDGILVSITGGSFSANSLSLQRTASTTTAPTATVPQVAGTGSGLYINGAAANVNLGALSIAVLPANSSGVVRMDAGGLTVTNKVLIGNMANTRWTILQINGGNFTNLDTVNGIVISPNAIGGSPLATNANNGEVYLSGGTSTVEKIAFGALADPVGGNGWLIVTNASLYVGSGGIALSNTVGYTPNISLLGNNTLGAKADWSSVLPMQLSGATVTIKAADAANVAHNITLSGALSGVGALTKTGGGTLTLSGANNYSGITTVSNGKLLVSSTIGSGAVTVLNGATLSGGGSITGDVTVNSGGRTFPGGGLTTAMSGNLTYNSGAEADFNLGPVFNDAGNDKITVGSTLNGNAAKIGINVTDTVNTNLDTTTDYVLLAPSGSVASDFSSTPVWLGLTPTNAANYLIQTSGGNVVLHYSPVAIALATATPNPAARSARVAITVNASALPNSIASISVDVSAINAGSPIALIQSNGTSIYTNSVVVDPATTLGAKTLTVTVTDSASNVRNIIVPLTITSASEVWNGGSGVDNQWSSGSNWTNGTAPLVGDYVTFAGTTRLTPNMEIGYSIGSLTFDATAGSFNITNGASTLTLTGNVTNNSTSGQTLSVPVALSGVPVINAAAGNITLSNVVSDGVAGSGLTKVGTNTLTLAAVNNTYTGPTTINNGVLAITADNNSGLSGGMTNNATLRLASLNAVAGTPLVLADSSTLQLRADADTVFAPASLALNNPTTTLNFDVDTLTGATGKNLTLTGALNYPSLVNAVINVTGGSGDTLVLGAIAGSTVNTSPHRPFTINVVPNISLIMASFTSINFGNDLTMQGGGNVTVTGNLANTSNGSVDLNVNGGTTVTLQGVSAKTGTGDGYRYYVNNGSLVLDNSGALTNNTTGTGLNVSVFYLGVSNNAAANPSNCTVYLGDASFPNGGLSVNAKTTNYVADGGAFLNTGIFTIGGQNTNGINTYANPIILGLTPNLGKGVTLVAATGGEVDFTGGILPNGTDTTAGVTVGDATHGGIIGFPTANTYGGGTLVTNGTLLVSNPSGSATGAGTVTVIKNGVLLINGLVSGNVNVTNGGTLGGILGSSGSIAGVVTNQSGGNLVPGRGTNVIGTVLNLGGNLILSAGSTTTMAVSHNGATNDQVSMGGGVNYGGTLTVVTNAGDSAFVNGDKFTLFKGFYVPTSSFTASNLPPLTSGLVWDTTGLTNDGSIKVVTGTVTPPAPVAGIGALSATNIFVGQSVVFTNLSSGSITNWIWNFGNGTSVTNASGINVTNAYGSVGSYLVNLTVAGAGGSGTSGNLTVTVKGKVSLGKPVLSGGSLILGGTNGPAGQQYRILSSTNVALNVTNWVAVWTNVFATDGSYSYTNSPLTNKATFFKLVSP